MDSVSQLCGVFGFAISTPRRRGGSDVRLHGWCCLHSGSVEDVRRYNEKSCSALVRPTTMTHLGVVFLLGAADVG
jgi:hypothetical protein